MNCKDCLHYEAHKHFFRSYDYEKDFDDYFNRENVEFICPEFAEKSSFVHLPCNVGDIVYCFAPCFDTDHHPKLKVVEKEIIELKIIATVFGLNFDNDSIGKTVFLTREEAEKALEEKGR